MSYDLKIGIAVLVVVVSCLLLLGIYTLRAIREGQRKKMLCTLRNFHSYGLICPMYNWGTGSFTSWLICMDCGHREVSDDPPWLGEQ